MSTKIFKDYTSYTFGNLLAMSVTVLVIPFYTMKLSPADYGAIALITIITRVMTRVVDSPVSHALKRFYYKPGYEERKESLTFWLLLFLLGKLFLILIVYLVLSQVITDYIMQDQTLKNLVLLNGFLLIGTPLRSFLANVNIQRRQSKEWLIIKIITPLITASVTLYCLFVLDMGVYGMMTGLIVSAFLPVPLNMYLIRDSLKIDKDFRILKEPLKFGYPLIFNGFANITIQSGDKLILQALMNISSVGLYSFGYTVSGVVNNLIVNPVKSSVTPAVYKIENDQKKQSALVSDISLAYYIISLLLVLVLSLFIQEAMMILIKNKDYWPSAPVIPVLAFSYVIQGLGNFFEIGLMMSNKTKAISSILVICSVLNVVLNFALVPFFGLMGAAYATLLSFLVWAYLRYSYCNKDYPIHVNFTFLFKFSIIVIVFYYFALFVSDMLIVRAAGEFLPEDMRRIVLSIGVKGLMLAIFMVILWKLVIPARYKGIISDLLDRKIKKKFFPGR